MSDKSKESGKEFRTQVEHGSAEDLAKHIGRLHSQGLGGEESKARTAEILKNSDEDTVDAYVDGASGG